MPPAGCSYRITLCTAAALPPSTRVLVAARGPDGYTLPVCPLSCPPSGLAPDVVHTSVVHTVADPGSLLTHLELYTESKNAPEASTGPPRRLLGRAGQAGDGDGDGSSWRVRWVAVEELAPQTRGGARSDDGSDDGSDDEEGATGDNDASRAAMRVFFFPVDKARHTKRRAVRGRVGRAVCPERCRAHVGPLARRR
jgi:hypothetical protein